MGQSQSDWQERNLKNIIYEQQCEIYYENQITLWLINDLPSCKCRVILEAIDHWDQSVVNIGLQLGIIIVEVLGFLLTHQSTIPQNLQLQFSVS